MCHNISCVHRANQRKPTSRGRTERSDRASRVGDRVIADDGLIGTVVCNIGDRRFSAEYPEDSLGYLQVGVMVHTDEVGLVHYPNANCLRRVE